MGERQRLMEGWLLVIYDCYDGAEDDFCECVCDAE